MDYVGAELMKDLQNSCVFKCKKEKNCLNSYGRDSLGLTRQVSGKTSETNKLKEGNLVIKIEQIIVVNEQ